MSTALKYFVGLGTLNTAPKYFVSLGTLDTAQKYFVAPFGTKPEASSLPYAFLALRCL